MSNSSKRGFAALSSDRLREIASKGGKAAHAKGTGHKFSHDEAVAAGRKGGLVSQASKLKADAPVLAATDTAAE